jgi:hypothetical protein
MHYKYGIVGDDLAAVYANDYAHGWTLTLDGVSYSNATYSDWYYDDWGEYWYVEDTTRVHATSFDFEFFGPDANILNAVVSQQLDQGGMSDGGYLELRNHYYYDPVDWSLVSASRDLGLRLLPLDGGPGVSFDVTAYDTYPFSADENGYPLIEPQRLRAWDSAIRDERPGNSGSLESANDYVDIGSSVPPVLPLTLNIADASVVEGNRGSSVSLTVTLSRSDTSTISVKYSTVSGTALAKSDFTASSGTLTFQAGETKKTVSVSITGDRKREANETFSVRLSNAVGATIEDGSATVTILNDD